MNKSTPLATELLSRLGRTAEPCFPGQAALQTELEQLVKRARQAWPQVKLDDQVFMAFLAERIDAEGDLSDALRNLHTGDLYLACACLSYDQQAISLFERRCFSDLHGALARLNLSAEEVDETKQMLRRQLFALQRTNVAPELVRYSGRGTIQAWLRVVAVRTAMRLIGRSNKEVPVADAASLFDSVLDRAGDPELELIKARYRNDFNNAVKEALGRLTVRERNLLKQRLIDRVPVGKLALMYEAHRGTIWRWLESAQNALLEHTRAVLHEELGVSPSECESLVRLARSQIDISLWDDPSRDDSSE